MMTYAPRTFDQADDTIISGRYVCADLHYQSGSKRI
jgi:hypothetical protein